MESAILWGLLVAGITEFLSSIRFLNFSGIFTFWLWLDLILGFIVLKKVRLKIFGFNFQNIKIDPFLTLLLTCVAFITLTVGLIAVVAPSNNWDSLDYHLPRVVHWIQNRSVEHYPTSYTPQLYSAPWSGFAVMHLHILSGGDRFANLVQWFSMVGSLIGVSLIAKQLGGDLQSQVFSVVLCATIPVGILHASNAKDTYVVAFWLVCFVYYVVSTTNEQITWNHIFKMSASLGLAIFSKGTGYIYGLPFFIWFVLMDVQRDRRQVFKHILGSAAVIVLINSGHYLRNIELFGAATSTYPYKWSPDAYGIPIFLSSIVKNASLHMVLPLDLINTDALEKAIYKFHELLGVGINDPRNTFGTDFDFQALVPTFEDTAGNPIHFWLLLLAAVVCLSSRNLRTNKYLVSYLTTILCSFFLFCLLVKWQMWHSRLHLPVFVLISPFIGIVLSKIFHKNIGNVIMIILLQTSLVYVLLNEFRPILGEQNIFNTNRIYQYLRPVRNDKNNYINAAKFVKETKCKNIGLSLSNMEYPWWIILNNSHQSVRIEHINLKNRSSVKNRVYPYNTFIPCAIISVDSAPSEEIYTAGNIYMRGWHSGSSGQRIQVFVRP
ncbi:glycosyltransferase family 39 protein [Tychonema sp. LEGE 07203]|nr:glycosyltransferase family 39 protein [Tychonema sp. LEGE 07203]MBE9096131.1 glycosyltransferase family 39 protein [Tychonema sp. LEGE 07203]